VPRRNKVNRWKVIIPIALIVAGIAITTYPNVEVVVLAIAAVAICWVVFPLIVSKFNEWLKIDREIWDLRLAIVLKIVQIGAFFAAGFWVSYNAYLLHKKEAARSATYGCVAKTTLRVDPIPGGDGQKSLYLVTVHTLVRNDTDRLVWINKYGVDFYVGKTLAEPSSGFFVQPPKLQLAHPTIEWKHFGRYIFEPKGYETSRSWQYFVDGGVIGQRHHNQEPKKDSEPTANSDESSILDTSDYLILPAGQHGRSRISLLSQHQKMIGLRLIAFSFMIRDWPIKKETFLKRG
jgi:hypothetical protein